MVKSKKRVKKGLADAVSSKKSSGVTKLNPFNIRTSKYIYYFCNEQLLNTSNTYIGRS